LRRLLGPPWRYTRAGAKRVAPNRTASPPWGPSRRCWYRSRTSLRVGQILAETDQQVGVASIHLRVKRNGGEQRDLALLMLTLRHQQNPLSDLLGGGATLASRSEEVVLAPLLARVQALPHSRRREGQKCPDTQLLPGSKDALDELTAHAAGHRRKDGRRRNAPRESSGKV